jgi:hypothetical protein
MSKLDSRLIYLAVFVSVLLPLFTPLGLPISVSDQTKDTYDLIGELPEASQVILSPSFSPSSEAEILPQLGAVLEHLMSRKARITWVNLNVEGIMYAERSMASLKDKYGYVYGVDYVVLPYLPGMQTAIASIASDFTRTFPRDAYGAALASMEALSSVKTISDFDLVVDFNTGDTSIYYLQQLQGSGVKIVSGASGVTVPYLLPYISSGQLSGLLGGLRGAAEYEMLSDRKGTAVAGMDAQSLSHGVILSFIIAGNVGFLKRGGSPK